MPATILAIADAVAAELSAATFSQPLAAERSYLPRFDVDEMTDLKVSVVPRGLASQTLDRNRDRFDYKIDVAIQKKVEPVPQALDPLMALVEEIADFFRQGALAAFPQARCTDVANVPVYAAEHLEELRQFTSVLTLTFRVWR